MGVQALHPNWAHGNVLELLGFFSHIQEKWKPQNATGLWSSYVSLSVSFIGFKNKIFQNGYSNNYEKQSGKDQNNLYEIFFRPWGHPTGFQEQKSYLVHFSLFLPTLKRECFVDAIVFLFIVE